MERPSSRVVKQFTSPGLLLLVFDKDAAAPVFTGLSAVGAEELFSGLLFFYWLWFAYARHLRH